MEELFGSADVWLSYGLETLRGVPSAGTAAMASWLLEESLAPPRGPKDAPHASSLGSDWVDVRWVMPASLPTASAVAAFQVQWAPAWGLVGWSTADVDASEAWTGA